MTTFLALTVLGVVVGCIYALTATGLVVTYTTSGIFNFAHGAIGMLAAFSYWQLTVAWGLPAVVGLVVVLLIGAPLFGALIERVLIRPVQGASVDLTLVITLGLLLFLLGLANVVWSPTETRVLPKFFASAAPVKIGELLISINQLLVVGVTIVVAIALKLLFSRTRVGIAMRGVVDDPDLAAMTGVSPARIQQVSWALGAGLAALAGILLAPLVTLDILSLTLLVISGYAAALIGRLKSLPLTAVGAITLGLLINYAIGYSEGQLLTSIQPAIPSIFLFVVLVYQALFLPPPRLKTSGTTGASAPTVPGPRQTVIAAVGLVVAAGLLSLFLSDANLIVGGRTFSLAIALLSLVLLVGYGGQVSLCQLTFVGLGAYAMGTWGGGSLLGVASAVALAAAAGALVALPALKLRGLYLALATFAFANAMEYLFFQRRFGADDTLSVPRLELPLLPTESDRAFFLLCAVAFAVCAVLVLTIRRGRYGRQLTALNDSPAACATLGLNVNTTKLVVFAVSAGLAGLSGALFGGLRGTVSPVDFVSLGSLALLLSLRIGGVNTVSGAFLGALFVATFPLLQDQVPSIPSLAYLLTGLAAISIGRDPDGLGGAISRVGARLRARRAVVPPSLDEPLREEEPHAVLAR